MSTVKYFDKNKRGLADFYFYLDLMMPVSSKSLKGQYCDKDEVLIDNLLDKRR